MIVTKRDKKKQGQDRALTLFELQTLMHVIKISLEVCEQLM